MSDFVLMYASSMKLLATFFRPPRMLFSVMSSVLSRRQKAPFIHHLKKGHTTLNQGRKKKKRFVKKVFQSKKKTNCKSLFILIHSSFYPMDDKRGSSFVYILKKQKMWGQSPLLACGCGPAVVCLSFPPCSKRRCVYV